MVIRACDLVPSRRVDRREEGVALDRAVDAGDFEAIRTVDGLREDGIPIPEPASRVEYVDVAA